MFFAYVLWFAGREKLSAMPAAGAAAPVAVAAAAAPAAAEVKKGKNCILLIADACPSTITFT